jgi:predicted HTH domain antitoxin
MRRIHLSEAKQKSTDTKPVLWGDYESQEGKMLWEVEQLGKISQIQPEIVEEAIHYLWEKCPALHKIVVVNAYIDGKINLSKAAELLEMSRLELERELKEKGIPIRRLSQEDIVAEVEAIKLWLK